MFQLTLVSHTLCPYVQRAAIALAEKNVAFDRVYIDLSNKPDWFKKMSPMGKVPLPQIVARDKQVVLFESAVIVEYLEETQPNPLHPADALERATHRGWIEFGSNLLNAIARLYNAKTEETFDSAWRTLRDSFERLEQELSARPVGAYFERDRFSLVDAVFAPIFRYFDVFESRASLSMFDGLVRIGSWRSALQNRPSVQHAVTEDYPELLAVFLRNRNSWLSARMA